MLAAGLVEELALLRSRYALRRHWPSMRCVGYRQAWSYLEGEIDRSTLRAQGIAATRQLAKRQFTWLRTMKAASFNPAQRHTLDAVADAIGRALERA
jgi:tRNA dimethylallyltransferase